MANTTIREDCKIFLQIIFVCNPLTMFFFNLFAPQKAARFAFQPKFGRLMQECYTFFASLMPFYWNKHWMTLVGVAEYAPRLQVQYCWEFKRTPETLKQMSEDALSLLWRKRGIIPLSNTEKRLAHATLFIEAGKMADYRFEEVLNFMETQIVRAYIKRGALPKKQLRMLTLKTACNNPQADYRCVDVRHELNEKFLPILFSYAKKYGMTTECLQIVHRICIEKPAATELRKTVDEAMTIYSQRNYTVSQKSESSMAAWRAFCRSTQKIYAEAQKLMSAEQYRIFHETGHHLDTDSILYFVAKVNKEMCQLIFRYEPDCGVSDSEVATLINATPELRNMFYQTLAEIGK